MELINELCKGTFKLFSSKGYFEYKSKGPTEFKARAKAAKKDLKI